MTALHISTTVEMRSLCTIDASDPERVLLYTHPDIDDEQMHAAGDEAATVGGFADWTIRADGITLPGWDRWVIEPHIE